MSRVAPVRLLNLPPPQLLFLFLVWLSRSSVAGFGMLAETGQSLPVPQDDGKAADQSGTGNNCAGKKRLKLLTCLRLCWVLRLHWHRMSGFQSSKNRWPIPGRNIKLCMRLVQDRVQGYTILEIGN